MNKESETLTEAIEQGTARVQGLMMALIEALQREPDKYLVGQTAHILKELGGLFSKEVNSDWDKARELVEEAFSSEASVGAYQLPEETLQAYHRLLDKKFSQGLTSEEAAALERVGRQLDEADSATPLEKAIASQAQSEQKRRVEILNGIISQLRSL